MMVAHCASITRKIRLGTAVVVLPLYNPARLAAEIATVDALSNGRLRLGIGAGYQPYEFERFGVDIKANLEMTEEFCDILDAAYSQDFFSYNGKHYRIPHTHIPARPVQRPLPILEGFRCRLMSFMLGSPPAEKSGANENRHHGDAGRLPRNRWFQSGSLPPSVR